MPADHLVETMRRPHGLPRSGAVRAEVAVRFAIAVVAWIERADQDRRRPGSTIVRADRNDAVLEARMVRIAEIAVEGRDPMPGRVSRKSRIVLPIAVARVHRYWCFPGKCIVAGGHRLDTTH